MPIKLYEYAKHIVIFIGNKLLSAYPLKDWKKPMIPIRIMLLFNEY